jgi:hypothetical protein
MHQDDVVAATQGRAFWILDDIGPLRQLNADIASADMHLFAPSAGERVSVQSWGGGDPGANPPAGTLIYYVIGTQPGTGSESARLEILDDKGNILNAFGTESPVEREERLIAWFRNDQPRAPLKTRTGLNRFVWDWRVADLPEYPELSDWRGPRAYRVSPGTYQARLTIGDRVMTQKFEVLNDPRSTASPAEHLNKQELLAAIRGDADAAQQAIESLKQVRRQIDQLLAMSEDQSDIVGAGNAVVDKITAWLDDVIEESNEHFIDSLHSSGRLDFNLVGLIGMVDRMEPPLTSGMLERVKDVRDDWNARSGDYRSIIDDDLAEFNRLTAGHSIPAISPSW